jgi:hypothetical protein
LSPVATGEIPPLRPGKSNLKIGNEVTNFWGGFSAKETNTQYKLHLCNKNNNTNHERKGKKQ